MRKERRVSEPTKQDEPLQGRLELEDEQLDTAVGGAAGTKGIRDGTSNIKDGTSNIRDGTSNIVDGSSNT